MARVDPLADALLAHAVRTVVTWLPRVSTEPDQAAPRLQLMLAAVMSGQGSDHTGGGLAQALSHAIGPRSSAPNGVVEALLLRTRCASTPRSRATAWPPWRTIWAFSTARPTR